MKQWTHAGLVKRARTYLKHECGCGVVLTELVALHAVGEVPDAIGWCVDMQLSILIECKTSRSDFRRDLNKLHRAMPHYGVGVYRFYMAPEGVIPAGQLPEGWGLIEVNSRRQVWMKAGPDGAKPYNWRDGDPSWRFTTNMRAEKALLLSALRRVQC